VICCVSEIMNVVVSSVLWETKLGRSTAIWENLMHALKDMTSTSLIRILPVVGFSKRVSNQIRVVFPTIRFIPYGEVPGPLYPMILTI
jgi:hypothetical protein